MANSWSDVPEARRNAIYQRWVSGEPVGRLAHEIDMYPLTLGRRLREMRQFGIKKDADPLQPVYENIYSILKKGPVTLSDLSQQFDRSMDTIQAWIASMRDSGYCITEGVQGVTFDTSKDRGEIDSIEPIVTRKNVFKVRFGVFSDVHFGSTCSQPTAVNTFIRQAVEDYGVDTLMYCGDLTAGIYGYRGHDHDLIPPARPLHRNMAFEASNYQAGLAAHCLPQYPNVSYYMLGGNHDWWHVVHSGVDVVKRVAQLRPDIYFLGYDQADIPLTEKVKVRLWHPSGGVPYAVSHRVQKGLDALAIENLYRIMEEGIPDPVRLLFAGHLHVSGTVLRPGMLAAQVGCFESQTNYLQRKGLIPVIAGEIWTLWFDDAGRIDQYEHVVVPFRPQKDDWANWEYLEDICEVGEPDEVEVIFQLEGDDEN